MKKCVLFILLALVGVGNQMLYASAFSSNLSATPFSQNISCFGLSDGIAWISVSGGTPPYSILWSNGASGDSISSLTAGFYSATVSDYNLDSLIFNFHILMPGPLSINANIIPDLVPASSGEINLTLNGSTPPYFFLWSNGDTSQNLSSIPLGDYQLTITDANLCQHFASYQVGGQSAGSGGMQTLWNYQHPTCSNPCNGMVNVTLNSNSAGINYLWSNGSTTQDITDLCPGTYTLTLTHPGVNPVVLPTPWTTINTGQNHSVMIPANSLFINGNMVSDTLIIGIFYSDNGVLECGGILTYEGTSTALPVWGDDSYTTDKDGFSAGESFSWFIFYNDMAYPLSVSYSSTADAGIFGVNLLSEVTAMHLDIAYGDTIELSLINPNPINISYTLINSDPVSGSGGEIDLIPSGGNQPYTFLWSNASSSEDLTNLSYGIYSVTLIDLSGCYLTQTFSVGYSYTPDPISALLIPDDVNCFGECNGSIALQNLNAPQPSTISWSTGSNDLFIDSLCVGLYFVTIISPIDTLILSTFITQPDSLIVGITSQHVNPQHGFDGYIDLIPTGGNFPYKAEWSNGDTSLTISNLGIGTYTFTLTDAKSCSRIDSVSLSFNGQYLNIDLMVQQMICAGENNGWAKANLISGIAPFTFNWSTGDNTDSIANLSAGVYTLTVSSFSGEQWIAAFEIVSLDSLMISSQISGVDPASNSPGSIQLSIFGGLAPYSFQWSTGGTDESLLSVDLGTYNVTIEDAAGCSIVDSLQVDFSVLPDWNLHHSTLQIHEVVFDDDTEINYNGSTHLPINTFIGAFYDSSGYAACGGYMVYRGNTGSISLFGNNYFEFGEDISWRIWNPQTEQSHSIYASYDISYPQSSLFTNGGLSRLDSLQSVSLSGIAYSEFQNPIAQGLAIAYRQEENRFRKTANQQFVNGQFVLEGLEPGKYLIHIQSDNEDQLPIYASNQSRWLEANPVNAFGYTGGIEIKLNPAQNCNQDCLGKISGEIRWENPNNQPFYIKTDLHQNDSERETVLPRILILLYQDQKVIQSAQSNENGEFGFANLSFGEYKLWIEIPGYSGEFYSIHLSETAPEVNDLIFNIVDSEILRDNSQENRTFHLFPNPATDRLVISFGTRTNLQSIQLFSIDGKEILHLPFNKEIHESATQSISLDIKHLTPGIYLLKLENQDAVQTLKMIKN